MKRRLGAAGCAALAVLALSPAHAQDPNDPGSEGSGTATPEEIQRANGKAPPSRTTDSTAEAASEETEGVGVSTRAGDPLVLAPGALEARVTRSLFGARPLSLSGALWLGAPQCSQGDSTAARRACLAATPRTVPTRLFALDLRSANGSVLAGRRIRGSVLPAVDSGAPARWAASVPVAGVRSGKYTGHILFPRPPGLAVSPVAIPVTLYVRDSPVWPLLALLLVLAVVMGLRRYRDGRLDEDTRYVEIADAEALIVTDAHLADPDGPAAPFRARFGSLLRAAAARVEKGEAAAPSAQMKEADALWVEWQAGRPDWVAGLEMDHAGIAKLTRAVEERAAAGRGESKHLAGLLKLLRTAYDHAPPTPTPPGSEEPAEPGAAKATAYRHGAAERAVRVTRYFSLATRIAEVRAEAGRIADPVAREKLLGVLGDAGTAWDADDEGSGALLAELRARVEAALAEALPGTSSPFASPDESVSSSEAARGGWDAADDTGSELVPRRFAARISSARRARRSYAALAGVVVYLAVAAVGLRETWGDNPTFGADLLADYLEVFAWALGANVASMASIATFAGQLSIPWLGRILGGGATPSASPDAPAGGAELAPLPPRRAPRLRRL
jgi:hypothetical protein